MMIFVQLRKRHLPQRDDQAASSGKQRQANRSITLPLCPPRQIADSWILCNSGAMPLGDKAKAALPLRAATLKQQAMMTRCSGNAASGKLVWNQHKVEEEMLCSGPWPLKLGCHTIQIMHKLWQSGPYPGRRDLCTPITVNEHCRSTQGKKILTRNQSEG